VLRKEVKLTIKTPQTSITDLGTEFGVSVDRKQITHLHVFEGSVSAETLDAEGKTAQQRTVLVDEAVYLRPKTGAIEPAPAVVANRFVRRIPTPPTPPTSPVPPVPLPLYSTGVGLAPGDADPNWQIVASKNNPDFVPQQAIVTAPFQDDPPTTPQQAQWISLASELTLYPSQAQYTFRMTFNLKESDTRLDRIEGGFRVDDLITAIRVNGTSVPVPKHTTSSFKKGPISFFLDGNLLKAGKNLIELDVRNAGKHFDEFGKDKGSNLALSVQWKGGR